VSAKTWRRIQLGHCIFWLLMIPPSVLWWRDSIPYLVGLSVWANVAGAVAAFQGARSEEASPHENDVYRVEEKLDRLLAQLIPGDPPCTATGTPPP